MSMPSSPAGGLAGGPAGAGHGPARAADEVRIDRLALRVAGLDEHAARELARLVAERLAPGVAWPAGQASVHHLHVAVPASQRGVPEPPDLLARRIVTQIGRVLAREASAGGPDGEVTW